MTSPTLSVGDATGSEYRANDRIAIAKHVIIGNTKYTITGRFEVSLPLSVVLRAADMAVAVEFDH